MNYKNIIVDNFDGISTITINRPNKLNALNKETIEELHNAFKETNSDSETNQSNLLGPLSVPVLTSIVITDTSGFTTDTTPVITIAGSGVADYVQNHLMQ